jgi:hypothetical protein
MTQYRDLYMRDFVGDSGEIPSTTRVAVSASPDIIPAGSTPTPDYLTYYAGNYAGPFTYYQNVQQNVANYVYVRAFNLFPQAQSGQIALFYAASSLLLIPSRWENNLIPNANGTNYANVSAVPTNTVAVGDSPFHWQPQPLQPSEGHYCLISRVVTTQDPNPIPSGDNLLDFARWVAERPGIAWRNVSVVTTLPAPTFSSFTGIENPEETSRLFAVAAICTDIPDNTTVSLVCPTEGPKPPLSLSGVVGPSNEVSKNPKKNVISVSTTLPKLFKSQLQLTANLPSGTKPMPDSEITISYFVATEASDDVADIAVDPGLVGLTPADVDRGVLLLLGDYTYEFRLGS